MTTVTFKTIYDVEVEIDPAAIIRIAEGNNDASTRIITSDQDVVVQGSGDEVTQLLGITTGVAPIAVEDMIEEQERVAASEVSETIVATPEPVVEPVTVPEVAETPAEPVAVVAPEPEVAAPVEPVAAPEEPVATTEQTTEPETATDTADTTEETAKKKPAAKKA